MQKWIISANSLIYDHASAFAKQGYIDWRQRAKYNVGDEVYIYCTRPFQKIMYKTIVLSIDMSFAQCTDDRVFWKDLDEYNRSKDGKYARLQLIEQADNDFLSLPKLQEHGLSAAPQGPVRMKEQLAAYIDLYLKDDIEEGIFPESDLPDNCYEGIKKTIVVNKYERSSVARKRCLAKHGYRCKVCGMDFESVYGDIGKKFIHVHHIIPLSKIGKEYHINYETDLVPVCPNCHAMLHHGPKGQVLKIDDLKERLLKNSRDGRTRID